MSFTLSLTDRERCEQLIEQLQFASISVAQTRHITEELGEELARLVLSSATLQSKAVEKLGGGLWWATQRALQQATPFPVAELKSTWFGEGQVFDLCCGLGGDAVHLGKHHPVVAVDRDPAVCLMAQRNMLSRELRDAEIRNQDVTSVEIPTDAWIHIDPDRREADRRSTDPAQCSPPWQQVQELLCEVRGGLVKLAPAASDVHLSRDDVHRVWISLGGEVREQSLLVGETVDRFRSLANAESTTNPRSAVLIDREQTVTYFCPTAAELKTADTTHEPGSLMIDPDAAIRSAGLTETFADQFGLKTLGGPSGFLTGDVDPSELRGLAISETVLWHGSCDDRKLRRELRALDCFPWRVKTRGVSQDPNQLEKKLRECGSQPCTLWIGKNGKRRYAVLTRKNQ